MDSPVNPVNQLILEAALQNASDLHFEPQKDGLSVRFRIDGFLQEQEKIPRSRESAVISRIKILAGLDIAEKRIGQDGRINFHHNGTQLDLRISTLPTIFGEKVVIRILSPDKHLLSLKEIGLTEKEAEIRPLLKRPEGLILFTGPTGSGKTTTLYAILKEIATSEKNTITIEEPVEYIIDGVSQVQVNHKAGLTFASGLRWILRQDPDIIMVGEVRDAETARLAVGAALTGHLVLATLHTNSANEAAARLMEMGIEPFLLAAALKGVIAQRLVRRLCPVCQKKVAPGEAEKKIFTNNLCQVPENLAVPAGCEKCRLSGYRGRTGIFEILPVDEKIKRTILNYHSFPKKINPGLAAQTLVQAGLEKVAGGVTSLEEIARVLTLN